MSIRRKWAFWRRVQYGLGLFFVLFLISGSSYLLLRDTTVSCFDGVQNGDEAAVDCDGSCVRICAISALPPKVLWTNSFEITEGQYNAVAYVENLNEIAATAELRYTFEFYEGNNLVTKRTGTTIFPPNSIYPIFEGRVLTEGKTITSTKLILEPVEIWQPATAGREQFRSSDINLIGADARPRLDATIENTELTPASGVEIVATLFNDAGQPLTASQTYIDSIAARSSENIVFTWPNSIARTVRSCIIPTDVVVAIDLSGSMNNDGGTPPQPITDALASAADFVARLGEKDQSGVVTFATNSSLEAQLSSSHISAATKINSLLIRPEEESGSTNTASALELAAAELSSERHNENARRVLVLLTDGLPTGKKDQAEIIAEVEARAKELIASGVIVYAIGLGENVDFDFVKNLASTQDTAFLAPTRTDLNAIYSEITGSICESGTAKIDIIAKTKANFTPLR